MTKDKIIKDKFGNDIILTLTDGELGLIETIEKLIIALNSLKSSWNK